MNVDVGTTANKIVQLDASSRLPAVNGSLLTNLPAWSLTGNTGTTAGTNFIGTTDAQALSFKTNNTERVLIDASGNIGLGVSIPRAQLHFSNAPLTRKKLVLFDGGNNDHQFHGFGVDESGALNYSLSNTANDHVFTAAASASASNELLRIKGNGDVGIGTSTPRAPLHLANSIRNKKIVLHETANNEYQFTGLGVNSTTGLSYVSPASTADHIFYSATSASAQKELMRLTGTGFLGIGVTQPHAPLHVTNTVDKRRLIIYEAANNEIQYYGLGLSSLGEMEYRVASAAAANDHVFYAGLSSTTERELMRIDGNGRIGIANTSPGYRLHVMAESPATAYSGTPFQGTALGTPGSGSQLFAIGTDGWIYAQGIVFASDQRIKTNINASTSREDLTTLMQLKVRDYQYKDHLARGTNSHKGFIAQEVKEVYPEAVTSTMKEFIPTVYAKAIHVTKTNEGIYSITTPTKHDFELNDRVRLITPQGDVVENVISIDGPQCFSIRTTRLQSTDDVFVFGKEISDMHIVDYDKIYTLGISAIQELYREIEALKKENEILKAKQTETSRNEVEKLKAEVAEIKRMLGVEASVKDR